MNDDLILEREINANKDIITIVLSLSIICVLLGIVDSAFDGDYYLLLFVNALILALSTISCVFLKKSRVVKYILIITLLISVYSFNAIVGYTTWLLFGFPLFLTCRYYDINFTKLITYLSIVLVMLSYFINPAMVIPNLTTVILVGFGCVSIVKDVGILFESFVNKLSEEAEYVKTIEEIDANLNDALTKVEELGRDVNYDALTGLKSRKCLLDASNKENPLAIFMIDVDDFKRINDTYGHPIGDEVLKKLGAILKEYGAKNNIEFYRYGGEEIVGLLNSNLRRPSILAREIVRLVRTSKIGPENTSNEIITISLGYSDTRNSCRGMLSEADQAMYDAKNNGKNCYEKFKG